MMPSYSKVKGYAKLFSSDTGERRRHETTDRAPRHATGRDAQRCR